jgi:hypothetical protein
VAEDAVLIGPVSIVKFPASREINREFRRFGSFLRIRAVNQQANSMSCSQIPYASEQGIYWTEQGIFLLEQGIFSAEQGTFIPRV